MQNDTVTPDQIKAIDGRTLSSLTPSERALLDTMPQWRKLGVSSVIAKLTVPPEMLLTGSAEGAAHVLREADSVIAVTVSGGTPSQPAQG